MSRVVTPSRVRERELVTSPARTATLSCAVISSFIHTIGQAYTNLVTGNPFFSGDSATEHHGKESGAQRKFRAFLERY